MSSEQKVVIVTGASQGIGAGLVRAYRDRNYRVVANSRSIEPGADADVTVLDLERVVTPDASRLRSKASNSPFLGWQLQGAAVMTIVRGKIVYDALQGDPR